MGNFNRDGGNRGGGGGFRGARDGGRPSFQKKSFGSRDGGARDAAMHKATCSECGNSCEVPFRPSSDKPVFCNDCFKSKREGTDRQVRPDFAARPVRREFNDRPQTRPSFENKPSANDGVSKQLAELNTKLDRLITSIEKMNQPKVASAPTTKPVEKAVVVKTKSPVKKVVKKVVAKKKK